MNKNPNTAQFLKEVKEICKNTLPNKDLWEWKGNFIFSWVLREVHYPTCTCSYCVGTGLHKDGKLKGWFGLALPECKAPNSWRILYWRWRGNLHLIRWTLAR